MVTTKVKLFAMKKKGQIEYLKELGLSDDEVKLLKKEFQRVDKIIELEKSKEAPSKIEEIIEKSEVEFIKDEEGRLSVRQNR